MSRIFTGCAAALALVATLPRPVAAHEGHAGDHAWLYGALQPLASVDHLLAGLFVVGVGALFIALIGRRMRSSERTTGRTRAT